MDLSAWRNTVQYCLEIAQVSRSFCIPGAGSAHVLVSCGMEAMHSHVSPFLNSGMEVIFWALFDICKLIYKLYNSRPSQVPWCYPRFSPPIVILSQEHVSGRTENMPNCPSYSFVESSLDPLRASHPRDRANVRAGPRSYTDYQLDRRSCLTCRKRKARCDETPAGCLTCAKAGTQCSYPAIGRAL